MVSTFHVNSKSPSNYKAAQSYRGWQHFTIRSRLTRSGRPAAATLLDVQCEVCLPGKGLRGMSERRKRTPRGNLRTLDREAYVRLLLGPCSYRVRGPDSSLRNHTGRAIPSKHQIFRKVQQILQSQESSTWTRMNEWSSIFAFLHIWRLENISLED